MKDVKQAGAGIAEPVRRSFFKRTGALAGGIVTGATLSTLTAHMALAGDHGHHHGDDRKGRRSDYGDLHPTPDQNGNVILALPKGFEYCTFSRTGETFGGGLILPSRHDGMAVFDGPGRTIRLIRNHEVTAINAPFPVPGVVARKYDAKGTGGCTTVDFDPHRKRVVRQFVSIAGTINNCSGGWSRHNSGWMTCEENTSGVNQGYEKPHGYVYFVPAAADSQVTAVPIKGMGRFSHEAAVSDSRGLVYLTEDSGNNSGFYRYAPADGGDPAKLEMLAVTGNPTASLIVGQVVGLHLPVHWVPVANPDPELEGGQPSCFRQGRDLGGAAFNRLEGLFRGEDGRSMFFVSTSGGTAKVPPVTGTGFGQLWHYIPGDDYLQNGDQLVLVFESQSGKVLESPDNFCLTPNGGVLFCEDDAVNDGDDVNRMIGLGPKGEPFAFATNIFSDSEFAGACFSQDGEILFVNIQGGDTAGSGMTIAIWGPWEKGPL
jgi:uncharacterized protein